MTYIDRVFQGSCESMSEIPDGVVHTCVTSPPYWGLRNYGTARWEGGDSGCQHESEGRYYVENSAASKRGEAFSEAGEDNAQRIKAGRWRERGSCVKCGATYVDEQLGLEGTPAQYIERLVSIATEIWRVLRPDGTLWLNLGDTYATTPRGNNDLSSSKALPGRDLTGWLQSGTVNKYKASGLKRGDLVGIPWLAAFALRDAGWYLRMDNIWHKTACMPESVQNRPTKAHEYLFLLAKQEGYYYDIDAIREPLAASSVSRLDQDIENQQGSYRANGGAKMNGPIRAAGYPLKGANKRSVWSVAPAGYSGAHFATFPPDLIRPCIMAGAPPQGLVLDPFMGSGTTARVALEHGRHFVGYELNAEYFNLMRERLGLFGEGVEAK